MDHFENDSPPQLVLAFFRWFCSPEFREDIEGDLLERFHDRATRLGVRKAKWLFTLDVLLLFRPGMVRDLNSQTHHKILVMKSSNWVRLAVINALLIVAFILPFLPGPPNKVVIVLSSLSQLAGFFGLLVVPIGLIWAVVEIREWRKRKNPNWRPAYNLAITAAAIVTAICLLLVIGLFINAGIFTGLFTLALVVFQVRWAIREIRKRRNNPVRKLNLAPFYLLTIPLVSLFARIYLTGPLSDYSREVAIQRSQVLIASIEGYKNKAGMYPESIRNLKEIPSPFIMGILDYRYNRINDHYSLSFSQWLEMGSLEEIVMYDRDNLKNNLRGEFAKYDYKLDLCRVKTAFASHDTRYNHWRYYHCD